MVKICYSRPSYVKIERARQSVNIHNIRAAQADMRQNGWRQTNNQEYHFKHSASIAQADKTERATHRHA